MPRPKAKFQTPTRTIWRQGETGGDQVDNIIEPVTGLEYTASGTVEYLFGDHSFTLAPVAGAAPALQLQYSFTGWGSVALDDVVTVNATVTDADLNSHDLAYVFATFENPDGSYDSTDRLDLVGAGTFQGFVQIPKYEQPGTWKLVIVAVDRAGSFMPAFSGVDVPVKLTHFTGSAEVGSKEYDLTYRLTVDNEATITIANGGTETITEDILLLWDDLYKFYIEVKEADTVVASRSYEPGIPVPGAFSFPVTLTPGEGRTYDVKGYKLSADVTVGSQPEPGNPYLYAAAEAGSSHLEVAITNPSLIDHTAPFAVTGMVDAVKAVVYRDGLPAFFFDVTGGTIVFEDTIASGETVTYEVKALTAAELGAASADYHLPKTYKIGIQAANTGEVQIDNPSAFVVWAPEDAVELVTAKFIGCITVEDKKTGECKSLKPGEQKHVQWNFKALQSADIEATMWIDGDNILPQKKTVVFTVAP